MANGGNGGSGDARLSTNYFRLFGASVVSNLGDGIALVAYPWLASAVTRSGLLVALVVVVGRLPWLIFSLPAGVITDRVDRRRLMVGANGFRAVVAAVMAVFVFLQDGLPTPDQIDLGEVAGTNWPLYLSLLVATFLLGMAEVLYDNTAQTVMPSIVESDLLEKANGRLWSSEQVMNTLVGPVLGAALLAVAFTVPFAIDSLTFVVSALLIGSMRMRTDLKESTADDENAAAEEPPARWQDDLRDGVSWLWAHDFLRPLAIILGLINMLGTMSTSTLVLYAQEVLGTSPTEFALMSTGGAAGGIVAGWFASSVTERIGAGPSLWLTIVLGGVTMIINGLVSNWIVVWAMFGLFMFVAVLWNVITVSLRQTIIPDHLLGRVNSVYRFFAWGMMPIGSMLAGLTILVAEGFVSRETALRTPWLVAGVLHMAVILYAGPKLTSQKIQAARDSVAAGVSASV